MRLLMRSGRKNSRACMITWRETHDVGNGSEKAGTCQTAWKNIAKPGATQQQLARLQAASLAQIERDKNQKILTAQKQLNLCPAEPGGRPGNNRLDAMMRKLDQASRNSGKAWISLLQSGG